MPTELIAHDPGFVHAILVSGTILETRVCPLVKTLSPKLSPVLDLIRTHCSAQVGREVVKGHDRDEWPFMGGRYVYTTYQLFHQCPGEATEHECAREGARV